MAKSRVTAYDVARLAGVSQTTVSFVLNHDKRAAISEETRQRVWAAAQELDYVPSTVARSLVTGQTCTIGLVVTTSADLFFAEIITVVEQASLQHGYSLLLANSGGDPRRELEAVRTLLERRVDGIIVTSGHAGNDDSLTRKRTHTPIVIVSNVHEDPEGYYVTVENRVVGREATKHLLELGHRRVAHIGGRSGEWDSEERQSGYEEMLSCYGLEVDPALILSGTGYPEGGIEAMNQLLVLPTPPTAVFCYNDLTAFGAMQAARDAGLSIPHDLSVVGVDDLSLTPFVEPPLTTVSLPIKQMGEIAVRMVLDLIAGAESVDSCVLPIQLVIRKSTRPPARGEP